MKRPLNDSANLLHRPVESKLQSGQSKLDKQTFEREELDRWMDENGIRELYSVRVNLIQQTPEQRQTERWKLCESEGLLMPSNTYAQFPRGIGKVAKLLGIKPQSLRDDLNKYRARKFSK